MKARQEIYIPFLKIVTKSETSFLNSYGAIDIFV